jgi:hypothetical protein
MGSDNLRGEESQGEHQGRPVPWSITASPNYKSCLKSTWVVTPSRLISSKLSGVTATIFLKILFYLTVGFLTPNAPNFHKLIIQI